MTFSCFWKFSHVRENGRPFPRRLHRSWAPGRLKRSDRYRSGPPLSWRCFQYRQNGHYKGGSRRRRAENWPGRSQTRQESLSREVLFSARYSRRRTPGTRCDLCDSFLRIHITSLDLQIPYPPTDGPNKPLQIGED